MPKPCKLLPEWRNFAASGHTSPGQQLWSEYVSQMKFLTVLGCSPNARTNKLCHGALK